MKHERIESRPSVMLGKPVIKGTRIPVATILRVLGKGASVQELLDKYPGLVREDIEAAQLFAADMLEHAEDQPRYQLSADERADLTEALAEIERGEVATEREVAEFFRSTRA